MNEPNNMRSIMEQYGRQVRLCLPDSESEPFGAFLQPLRYIDRAGQTCIGDEPSHIWAIIRAVET